MFSMFSFIPPASFAIPLAFSSASPGLEIGFLHQAKAHFHLHLILTHLHVGRFTEWGRLSHHSIDHPRFSVWCSAGQPWLTLPDGITRFADYPDGTFGG